jgi:hypothetical protein
MLYNKQFGLDFLNRILSRTKNVRVLRYIRYENIDEIDPRPFCRFRRILVRSNLDGDVDWKKYCHLPRTDIDTDDLDLGLLRLRLESQASYWHNKNRKFRKYQLHFLLHGVTRREDILFAGVFRPAADNSLLQLRRPNPGQSVWETTKQVVRHCMETQPRELETKLEGLGMNPRHAVTLTETLHAAATTIVRGIKKENLSTLSPQWAASFSIQKNRPTGIVFYGCIFEGKGPIPRRSSRHHAR